MADDHVTPGAHDATDEPIPFTAAPEWCAVHRVYDCSLEWPLYVGGAGEPLVLQCGKCHELLDVDDSTSIHSLADLTAFVSAHIRACPGARLVEHGPPTRERSEALDAFQEWLRDYARRHQESMAWYSSESAIVVTAVREADD